MDVYPPVQNLIRQVQTQVSVRRSAPSPTVRTGLDEREQEKLASVTKIAKTDIVSANQQIAHLERPLAEACRLAVKVVEDPSKGLPCDGYLFVGRDSGFKRDELAAYLGLDQKEATRKAINGVMPIYGERVRDTASEEFYAMARVLNTTRGRSLKISELQSFGVSGWLKIGTGVPTGEPAAALA